jgi:hypothetical protein
VLEAKIKTRVIEIRGRERELREGRRESYRDLVERNLRLEVDIISGRREDAFHFLNYNSICFRSSREEKGAVFEWIEFIDINRQVFSIIFNDFLIECVGFGFLFWVGGGK